MSSSPGRPAHVPTLELLEAPAEAVDAGATLSFSVRASCPCGCDVGSAPLVVEGPGADAAALEPAPREDGGACDVRVSVRAPAALGPAHWTVRLSGQGPADTPHGGPTLRVETRVVPHRTSLAVWQVPSPLLGSAFAVRVGVKCSARCALGGARVLVLSDSGVTLGEGALGRDPRPGSDGFFEGEVSLVAPGNAGVALCRARFDGHGLALPHESAEASFSFRTLEPAECAVTVRIAGHSGMPLDGIEVRLGPYRAETDGRGIARLGVSRGAHQLSAWRIDLEPVTQEVDVSEDAELTLEVGPRRRVDADEREWM